MIQKLCFAKIFPVISLCLLLGACSSEEFVDVKQEPQSGSEQAATDTARHTIPMKLVGGVESFDQKSKLTKSAIATWNEGDKIYIRFYNESSSISGDAVFNATTGWKVSYDGTLAAGTKLKSEVRYFENPVTTETQFLTLNSASIAYEDIDATYDFDGSELIVKANLKPKTGRLRFKGKEGEKIYLTGLKHYTYFSWAHDNYNESTDDLSLTVAKDGYTPYVYAEFESTDRTLCIVGNGYAFTRKKCNANILKPGESGNMTIPTDDSHDGWLNGFYCKHNAEEYRLIPVVGHKDGFFLIGETEVTDAFYGSSETACHPYRAKIKEMTYSSDCYYSPTDYSPIISFLPKWTDLPFKEPTLSQWQYAAQGGNKTVGYTYSGSNTRADVASIVISCVKTLAPNELGLYDMSGNEEELAWDEQNEKYVLCGGGDYTPTYYRERPSAIYANINASAGGFRLVMKPNF